MSAIMDGNEAAASVAHRLSEVIAIYPITPASPMAELSDEWSSRGVKNLWGVVPDVVQLQSEAGAIATVHGALQTGALSTTFTASQGLLLMIPNLYKIAGELTPFAIHVAARSIATHGLSIFGDHSDVMACRQTGVAMLCSSSVQEAHDFAAVAHAATLRARLPFMHFFDGFRTSHELARIETLSNEDLARLVDARMVEAHRARAMTPDRPVLRGTTHNPDTFFQVREAANPFYDACPSIVARVLDELAAVTGRRYHLFDYEGAPDAERVIVLMGSGSEAGHEAVEHMAARGERVGIVKVRLYRPFDARAFLSAIPTTARAIAVLDRTKEPGAPGEPLYLDVLAALSEAHAEGVSPFAVQPRVVGGRYGLSSKELTPGMVEAIFGELGAKKPKNHFTVGIRDDVTHRSIAWDDELDIEPAEVTRAVFYGLGSDGTVGAAKNIVKIVGDETDLFGQGYFVYDSKKSGSTTISHLRFSKRVIRSTYLIKRANFIAVSQSQLVEKLDVLEHAAPGAVLVLNTKRSPEDVYASLPAEVGAEILRRGLHFHVIDAHAVAAEVGLPGRVSTVMQACFFALAGVLPGDTAMAAAKKAIEKTFAKRGIEVVKRNVAALEIAPSRLRAVPPPSQPTFGPKLRPVVPSHAPDFVQRVTAMLMAGKGDQLPVSAFPIDGTWPTGTTQYEKRMIAREIPIWDPAICIQCNKCALVCPHATIRANVYAPERLAGAPASFRAVEWKAAGELKGEKYTIQVAPDDCTGCGLCVAICPAKDKSNPRHKAIDMLPVEEHRLRERESWAFFETIPEPNRLRVHQDVKGTQLLQPLFEFSGACAGCGETPYLKLMSQLFGDRALIANATGCSSIYGGNLPTTPWRTNAEGRGPTWANSLFEDNAEFGLGFRYALDAATKRAKHLLALLAPSLPGELVDALARADQTDDKGIGEQRERVVLLRQRLQAIGTPEAAALAREADALVKKSVWIVGGDGWAYDIGFGGLDHVFSTSADVNVLVMDTEVYSNTGGQQSKATPIGAMAKFASAGKETGKKDLGMLAMSYGHVYVASVAIYAKDAQTIKAFAEAESYPGPSVIIAHSPCIAHGYEMSKSGDQQRLAVESGLWPVYRYDPRRVLEGEPPLKLESGNIKAKISDYMRGEGRFRAVELADKDRYARLVDKAERFAAERRAMIEHLAALRLPLPQEKRDH